MLNYFIIKMLRILMLLGMASYGLAALPTMDPNCGGKQVMVHLFEYDLFVYYFFSPKVMFSLCLAQMEVEGHCARVRTVSWPTQLLRSSSKTKQIVF